jgi:hypothetical protein
MVLVQGLGRGDSGVYSAAAHDVLLTSWSGGLLGSLDLLAAAVKSIQWRSF